jgi:hypothetical protein
VLRVLSSALPRVYASLYSVIRECEGGRVVGDVDPDVTDKHTFRELEMSCRDVLIQ